MSRRPNALSSHRSCSITGGAGFIGTNVAARLVESGRRVRIFDNLSRRGVEQNLLWLRDTYGDAIESRSATSATAPSIDRFVRGCVGGLSLRGAGGGHLQPGRSALRLRGQRRRHPEPAGVAALAGTPAAVDLHVHQQGVWRPRGCGTGAGRQPLLPADTDTRMRGISEDRSVDFHSPYGCSKGAADQYVLDYARTFGMPLSSSE